MRYKIFVLLLLASLSACSFQAQVLTPESFIPVTETEMPSVTPLPALVSTSTPNPPPTDSNVLPTFTSAPLPQTLGVYPIRFAPNGTYVDVGQPLRWGKQNLFHRRLEGTDDVHFDSSEREQQLDGCPHEDRRRGRHGLMPTGGKYPMLFLARCIAHHPGLFCNAHPGS